MRILHLATIAAVAALSLTACSSDTDSGDSKAAAPPYKIVKQEARGKTRNLTVEVNTTKDLRGVFDSVTNDLSVEAGYWVIINCSTGGTASVDNRLANGRYAVGNMGAAVTGLNEGGSDFSINKDRSCPDKEPAPDYSSARKAAGIPERPTGKKRQDLLDTLAAAAPDVVRYEDKAVDAARNQCSALNDTGVNRIDWLASQRFTYKDVTTTEAQGAKINAALKSSGFCKV
ncbi:hypothetical protein PV735_05355 [Streptomyces turgidiscabies]|nr:hypothetical protein [Streptomyces turgidiscabies]MDX3492116.1 hypothetical protein [Streptomyces turgidiscabies]